MQIPYIQQNYIKYNIGKGFLCGHVDALHAMPPEADQFTDIIVEKLIKMTGCAGIISTISRMECDLNREVNSDNAKGIAEYRKVIREIIEFLHIYNSSRTMLIKPYLHLSFHGMKDDHYGPLAIEIGTLKGQSCSPEVKQWLEEILSIKAKEIIPEIAIVFDKKFYGDQSIAFHRQGDGKDYLGYGPNFHTFQIELSRTIRKKNPYKIAALFAHIMTNFQTKFVTNNQY